MRTNLQRRRLLAAGAALALSRPSRAAEPIVVGQIAPFTGIPAQDAPELNRGIKAAIAQVNAAGGIAGRSLSFFELDDGYDVDIFVRQFGEAMKRHPVALLAPVGSRAIQRMLSDKLLDTYDTLVLNPVPGAERLRNPGHPRLFHVRAGDQQQIEHILRHAQTMGVARMAVLQQDTPIGISGLASARKVADELHLTLSVFATSGDAAKLASAAAQAAASGPQSTLVLGAPGFVADAVAALRAAGETKFVYALGYVPPSSIAKLPRGAGRGVALAQVCPDPNGATTQLQHAFQSAMRKSGIEGPYSAFHFEGYITARVLFEGLRHARSIDPGGLATALHAMGEIDLGGCHVNFARGNTGGSFVDIAMVDANGHLVF